MKKFLYKVLLGSIDLISLLPFWILHRISDLLYILIFYIAGYRKNLVLQNLKRSFPNKSEKEIRIIRKAFFRHFSDIMVESVKSATMKLEAFKKRYRMINPEVLNKYYATGKSVIILSPHTGNWEWIFSLVPQIPYEVYAVYQRLNNPHMDQYIRRTRQRFGAKMIPTTRVFRIVMGALQQGEQFLTWFAADQAARPAKAEWVTFLNQDTSFHKGFGELAKKTGQPVLFLDIKKVRRSYYELEFHVIADDPSTMADRDIVKEFARLTEKRILKDPPYWLWSHRRWKHSRPKN